MQKFILIPELACIVRKDAYDGRHVAYHDLHLPSAQRNYEDLLSDSLFEHRMFWDKPGRTGYPNITTAQEST